MAKVKQGDAVMVAARDQTPQDVKSGLYYPHYAGLRGTVLKLYGEEASVTVDRDSLPSDVRVRHEEGEKAMRQKWLDNLSEVATGRLGEHGKQFALNYTVLVSVADLSLRKGQGDAGDAGGRPPGAPRASVQEKQEAKAVARAARAVDPLSGESDVRCANSKAGPGESGTDSAAKRLSALALDAAEEEFLAQRKARASKQAPDLRPPAR